MNKATATLISLSLALGIAACGSGSTGKTDTFTVKVTGSKSDPSRDLQAKKGDTISLSITTDKDEEVHLHGYDLHFDCKAGVPLVKTFTADKTGSFEYELEATSGHLGNLVVNP